MDAKKNAPMPGRFDFGVTPPSRARALRLRGRLLLLFLLLRRAFFLLFRAMLAHRASRGCAEQAVVPREVPGNAAHRRALGAALGIRRAGDAACQCRRQYDQNKTSFHAIPQEVLDVFSVARAVRGSVGAM